jgi:hypothetical protein
MAVTRGARGWTRLIEAVTDHLPGAVQVPFAHIAGDRRDLRLDACRGVALWFIFIDHIPNNALSWLTLRNYGFSDTSEVFVFVSGYTCMLAYGGALPEQGWPGIVTRALRRSWEIYVAFLLLLIAYFILVWLAGGGSRYLDETNTGFFFKDPGPAIMHAAALQYTPVNTDILSTFVLLHLAFPGLLWLMIRSTTVTLVLSFLLYLMVQRFGWYLPAWPSGEIYFNPLAWQLLFVLGAWYAYDEPGRLRTVVRSRTVLVLAIFYLLLSLAVALSWQIRGLEGFLPAAVSNLIYPIYKGHLAPVRLLHFLSLAIVVSRLTPRHWQGLPKSLITALIRCGENSLALYCTGVLLAFIGFVILTQFSNALAMQVAVSLAGIVLMIVAATLLTWESKLDQHWPRLF